ncbi:MAG: hypothetical protein WD066_15705 [Planctomycetaceae bacterium]
MSDDGYNPMRWECRLQGCFNRVKRPKIEELASSLPRKIGFSDVDGIVELGGNLLVLEWKENRFIPRGQRLLYERWTRFGPATVLLVVGDAESMSVEELAVVHSGCIEDWQPATLDMLQEEIREWADWAQRNPQRLPAVSRIAAGLECHHHSINGNSA